MQNKSALNTYGPVGISWTVLKEVDADKPPMPNEGIKAIAQICNGFAASSTAMAASRSAGLGNIVGGNNAAMLPAANQISSINAAALTAGVIGAAALSAASKDKPKGAESAPSTKPTPKKPETKPSEAPKESPEKKAAPASEKNSKESAAASKAPAGDSEKCDFDGFDDFDDMED